METTVIIGIVIIIVSYGIWVTYEQKRKKEKILRELVRVRYQSQTTVNFIEMSKITPHGPKDRDDYLDLAIQSAFDSQEIAANLSKEL